MTTEKKIEQIRHTVQVASQNCGGCKYLLKMIDELFPPPKRGCWGFFYDVRIHHETTRILASFRTKELAEKSRREDSKPWDNASSIFFIEEPCAK